jgi:hypothetical protein
VRLRVLTYRKCPSTSKASLCVVVGVWSLAGCGAAFALQQRREGVICEAATEQGAFEQVWSKLDSLLVTRKVAILCRETTY